MALATPSVKTTCAWWMVDAGAANGEGRRRANAAGSAERRDAHELATKGLQLQLNVTVTLVTLAELFQC